jgi:hypothetical protein
MPTSIYSNIVQVNGTKANADKLAQILISSDPDVAAANKIANQIIGIVPPGGVRRFLAQGPWKLLWKATFGRKYTIGQYKLGERFIKQLGGNMNMGGWQDVPNNVVEQAMNIFTILFGVRIGTGEDLDALDSGVDAYYARGEKNDIPQNAVKRAVYLKQNFYPISTYNKVAWDPSYFERYPLVAPIPGLQQGTLYSGPLPGGATAVNGIIPVNADSVMKQILTKTGTGQAQQSVVPGISSAILQKYAPVFAILLVVGIIISIRFKLFKP